MDIIVAKLQAIIETGDTILIFEDLQHMRRGGRLTPAAALLGGLLRIKPVLHLNISTQGKVDVMAKPRTLSKAQSVVIERLKARTTIHEDTVFLAHVDAQKNAEAFAKKIETEIEGMHVHVIDLVSAVGVHTGLGCLALQVFDTKA